MELSVSQVCTEKVSTWRRGRGRAQGAPLVVSHSRWRENGGGGGGVVITSIFSSVLVWRELLKTDDLHFLWDIFFPPTARPPRIQKRRSEVWKGTERENEKSESVWGGIERQKQAHFQFDKADMKRETQADKRKQGKVLTVILLDSSFLPSRVVIENTSRILFSTHQRACTALQSAYMIRLGNCRRGVCVCDCVSWNECLSQK